jgi:hypothetical protein
MPVARITGPGLAAIALSVALLWGCVIGQRVMMRQALLERARVMRQLVYPQHRTQPVSVPAPFMHQRHPRSANG